MAPTPTQLAWRERIEAGLRVAEPFLNLVLAVGDRVSRWVDRHPADEAPTRPGAETERPRVERGPERR